MQITIWYGSAYLVFMWVWHGASAHWVYYVLDWSTPLAVALYLALPPLLLVCATFWYARPRSHTPLVAGALSHSLVSQSDRDLHACLSPAGLVWLSVENTVAHAGSGLRTQTAWALEHPMRVSRK